MIKEKKSFVFFVFQAVIWFMLFFCTIEFSFSQGVENQSFPENPLKGSHVFFDKGCIKCHAVMGLGETFGPDLTSIGRHKNFYGLAGALWSHSPKMLDIMMEKDIERPELTPEETGELIAYIYYQGFFDELGDPRKGEDVFSQKRCAQCHSLGGSREKSGPSLDKFGRYISPVFIAAALWNHSSTVSNAMVGQTFAPHEMSHLLAFIKENALNTDGELIYMESGSPKRGQEIFEKKGCQVCHGPKGQSLNKSLLRRSLTDIVGTMWNHSNLMWEEMRERGLNIPNFDNREMADLVAFLYYIPYYGENADLAAGQRVFEEKGCILCHSQESEEEEKGPNLSNVSQNSVLNLISAMWNHVSEMEKMVTESNLVWPRFTETEMKNLIRYIQSLK